MRTDDDINNTDNDEEILEDEALELSTEFLENEDHIEFVGGILGEVFESEEEALVALGRIVVNGKRLGNVTDIEEAVKIIREAMVKGGTSAISIEVNGSLQPIDFSDEAENTLFDTVTEKPKKKKKKIAPEPAPEEEKSEPKKEEEEPQKEDKEDIPKRDHKTEKEQESEENAIEYPENDRTEDVYTFTRPEEFNLKYDTYSEDFLSNNVSGIVVLSRLSGMQLSEKGNSKENLERAADRLYVNGMPALAFYGLGKKEKLTEEDYNTLGTAIADTLKETFLDGKKGNYVMFRGEREDKFTAFTMSSDTLINEKPKEVKLYSPLKKTFSSKDSINNNMAEYDNYVNYLLPQYEKSLSLKEISEEASRAAASVMPLDKIKKTSINNLQREKGIIQNSYNLTAPVAHMEKTENQLNKEPELMAPGKKSRPRPSDNNN